MEPLDAAVVASGEKRLIDVLDKDLSIDAVTTPSSSRTLVRCRSDESRSQSHGTVQQPDDTRSYMHALRFDVDIKV